MNASIHVLRPENHKRTCIQCRMRKVRCDGHSPTCGHCRRLGYNCLLATSDDYDLTPSKIRRSNACRSCRKRRAKCSGDDGGCSNCVRSGTDCVYPVARKRRTVTASEQIEGPASHSIEENHPGPSKSPELQTQTVSSQSQSPVEAPSPPFLGTISFGLLTGPFPSPTSATAHVISIDILEIFFRDFYPLPSYSFLHFYSLRQKCLDGILDEALALAIRGIVALQHLSPGASAPEEDGTPFTEQAESLIFRQLENASMPRLQAMILVLRHRIETKQFQRAFMLAGIAGRFATALHLNDERYDLDAVPQEVRRRTMWSFKLLETYFSIGLEYELWPFENIYLKYPCRESDFEPPEAQSESVLPASGQVEVDDFGTYSCCVRLISLRRDIMKLNRSVSIQTTAMPELPQLVVEIEEALSKVKMYMPESDFPALLKSHNRWLPRYVMMFACWHQCHCDLYRLLLQGYSDSAPRAVLDGLAQSFLGKAEELCTKHALDIIQMLVELNLDSVQRLTLEYDTAICAYQATRILLFLARHGKLEHRPSLDFASSRAELCLASLNRFFSPVLVRPIVAGIQQMLVPLTSECVVHESERGARFNPRLSWAAQTKNRLAIHSLLRQADFPDDEDKNKANG